ncbi:MAG: efflux RND transporter periplasmic adaptor subunit [Acetobacteraceae bacterium]
MDGTQQAEVRGRKAPARSHGKLIRRTLLIAALVAVIAVAADVYFSGLGVLSTDDAFIDGEPVAMAPQISGKIIAFEVTDNEFVHEGSLLVVIDPRAFVASVDQAKASLASAQAQLKSSEQALAIAKVSYPAELAAAKAAQQSAAANLLLAAQNETRQLNLRAGVVTSVQNQENAVATANAARAALAEAKAKVAAADDVNQQIAAAAAAVAQKDAAVAEAEAALEQAEVNLSYTRITAPVSGWITKRGVGLGSYVQPGQTMFSLVKPDVWITANFKETQLRNLRAGQRVSIHVDAYPELHLTGRIESIQRGSGAVFTPFPAENATGNFVKIVQRVPVKIEITGGLPKGHPLPLGLSVEPVVHIR